MTKKILRSLLDWNSERVAMYRDISIYPAYNGIACPHCQKELMDQHELLLTEPPQRLIFCRHCDFRGQRVL